MKPKFYPVICIFYTVFTLLYWGNVSAQSLLIGTFPGASEDLLGVRYRNVRTSNANQNPANYNGIPDLGTNRNGNTTRVERNLSYGTSGSYTFSVTYNAAGNSFVNTTTINGTTYTTTFSSIASRLIADGKTASAVSINLLKLAVRTQNNSSSIQVSNLTVDGIPISGTYGRTNNGGESFWFLNASVLNNGFVITGTVTLAGSFTNNAEGQRIQFTFGNTSSNPGILPVVWGGFTTKRTNASTTLLEWKTMQEQNASHYYVQRSVDGVRFETIGQVTAKGTTSTVTEYRFEDKHSTGVIYYYRLQQVDFDAKLNFSSVVKQGNGGKQTLVGGLGSSNIHVQFFTNDNRQLRILTINGTVVKQISSTSQQHTIDMNSFPPGVYALQIISSDGSTEVHRFVK